MNSLPFFPRNSQLNRNEFANIYLQTPNDLVNFLIRNVKHNHLCKQCENMKEKDFAHR